jgi:hypothetical protein
MLHFLFQIQQHSKELKMIKSLKVVAFGIFGLLSLNAQSAVLDFEDSANLGVSLGGGMFWNGEGGGHLYDEFWDISSDIIFAADTFVNSVQLNNRPWQDFPDASGTTDYSIQALDIGNNVVWSTLVDLTGFDTWDNWLTVNINVASVRILRFGPAGPSMWPAIDNLVINESGPVSVPEPSPLLLLLVGLISLAFSRRRNTT